jgi:hypothetical protein
VVLSTIRAVETWTTGNVVGGIALLAVAFGAAVWVVRVILRR